MLKISKSTKLWTQLTLSVALLLAELIVGYMVNSIALIADAFHMLNDVISLGIALYAVKLANKKDYDPKYSYGWQRAEVLGALINAVLLLGLCFTIFVEAIPRFFNPVEIENPQLILIVGSMGLVFNVFGMFLFGGHGHCHSHSNDHDHEQGHSHGHSHGEGAMNMYGVYLHVLGDALASLAVIATALIIWLCDFKEKYLFDPIISIFITLLIIKFTIPLIKSASFVLLQGTPSSIPLDTIRTNILNIPGIKGIHDLHIWQLTDTKIVASAHISVASGEDYMSLAGLVKKVLHDHGVHSATIQPEVVMTDSLTKIEPIKSKNGDTKCLLSCSESCEPQLCCPPSP